MQLPYLKRVEKGWCVISLQMILAYEKGIEKPNSHINFVTLTTF
jgi:hypothetical protein